MKPPFAHKHYLPGQGMTLAATSFGDTISSLPSRRFKHPWWTTPAWSPQGKRWVATVQPGFVNSTVPIYRATIEEQKALGNPWEIDPLTGERFFSASVFSQPSTAVSAQVLDLPLYFNPAIPLDFYGIGFDGDANAGVPEYFVNLGARRAVTLKPGQDPDSVTPPPNLRLLRACDIWLHQPRAALTSSFAPGGLGDAPYIQHLSIRLPAASDVTRVFQGFYQPIDLTAGIDPTSSDFEEPNFDQVLISTVYLLSPPNTPIGSMPDATWSPYVRHNLFWNLMWTQPEFRIFDNEAGTFFLPPLAGGAASIVLGIFQSLLADAAQTAYNSLFAHSLAGTFWTATGGGHDATYAAIATAEAAATKLGPDKKRNAAARLAAFAAQRRAVQLDPDFPYRALPFQIPLLSAA